MEPSNENIKGREIIDEDLREKCIYEKSYSDDSTRYQWWAYMQFVHQNCYNVINEDCSRRAHERLGLNFQETQTCMKRSFVGKDWGSNSTYNTIIDSEIEYWKTYGSGIYPSLVINNRTYRGQLETLAVFNALCAGFENPPPICAGTLNAYTPDFIPEDDGIKAGVIVAIVVILILVNVIIVYCYRRYAKREM